MKNVFSKLIIAGVISAALSPLVYAADTALEGIDPELIEDTVPSINHNDVMDKLLRDKERLTVESDLAKARLEMAKTDQEIKKIKGLPVGAAVIPAESEITGFDQLGSPSQQIPQVIDAPQPAAEKKKVDNTLDRVFVTRVYGLGALKSVTVYFDNGIFTGYEGDEIVDGLKILSVNDNGAIFSYKGKTKRVNLTTQDLAYKRSLEEYKKNQSNSSQQRPSNFGVMAQEIGGGMMTPPPHPR